MSPIRLILLATTIVLLLGGCDREKDTAGQGAGVTPRPVQLLTGAAPVDRSRAGSPASQATFIAPDDAVVTLASFRGTPVLLNLWATWCAPCIKEMPSLDQLAKERSGKLVVLTVAQDIQGAAVVDPWFRDAALTRLQPYLDPENNLLAAYNSPLPVSILFDAAGQEVWRITGALDWQGQEARRLIDEAG